ncbi:MAG TPA: hypothetical protein VMJ64_17220 [Anaerolineales bacterium]|nr:hypothetical protein [Anaerolineales bacterium]
MDPISRVMCDVAGLLARGSDAARMETRRMAAERERRSAAHATVVAEQPITTGTSAGERGLAALRSAAIIAFGSTELRSNG